VHRSKYYQHAKKMMKENDDKLFGRHHLPVEGLLTNEKERNLFFFVI